LYVFHKRKFQKVTSETQVALWMRHQLLFRDFYAQLLGLKKVGKKLSIENFAQLPINQKSTLGLSSAVYRRRIQHFLLQKYILILLNKIWCWSSLTETSKPFCASQKSSLVKLSLALVNCSFVRRLCSACHVCMCGGEGQTIHSFVWVNMRHVKHVETFASEHMSKGWIKSCTIFNIAAFIFSSNKPVFNSLFNRLL
jgi:hypothetical protein